MSNDTKVTKIGIKTLDSKTLEEIALLAEKAIEKYLVERIGKSNLHNLDTKVSVEYNNELTMDVYAQATLSPLFEEVKNKLLDEAVNAAFETVEKKLREITNERPNKEKNTQT